MRWSAWGTRGVCILCTRESGFGAFVRVARILRSVLEAMVNYTLDQVRHYDIAAVADAQGRVLEDGADADICFKMCQNKISPTSRKKQMKWNRSDWLILRPILSSVNPIHKSHPSTGFSATSPKPALLITALGPLLSGQDSKNIKTSAHDNTQHEELTCSATRSGTETSTINPPQSPKNTCNHISRILRELKYSFP